MKLALVSLLMLLCIPTFGSYTNKELPLTIKKIEADTFRVFLVQGSIESKIKLLITGYLNEKQTPDSLTDLMADIRALVVSSGEKGTIINPSISVDEKKFVEDSRLHFEVKFGIPSTELEETLTFEFLVIFSDEDETVH